jgi:two-component system phosphate regulon sensor histidine kinase PhoR
MLPLDWKVELRRLLLLTVLAVPLGLMLGELAWMLLAAASLYIGWFIFHLNRLNHWLNRQDDTEPPEAAGLWGAVLDGIYRLQRQAREEQLRLQATVDYLQDSFASLHDAAVMIDPQGNIAWSNRASDALLGLKYAKDTGQQLVNLIRSPAFIAYFDQGEYQQPLELVSPANDAIFLQITVTYFGKGSRLMFARDITQTHQLLEMRKDFVANVSHELRTPLTVITGYVENLLTSPLAENPRWQRAITQMLAQSQRMESLLQDLMTLTRLESAAEIENQQKIDVCQLLATIKSEVIAVVNGARSIVLECDDQLALHGNQHELRSAFTNLMVNAARYTDEGGHITVKWFANSQYAYLQVIDDGIGIEPQHIPRLTERFYRVDKSRSSHTGGTGLGLAIVKHILLKHQAQLQITSELGKGSVFSCRFPLSRSLSASQ